MKTATDNKFSLSKTQDKRAVRKKFLAGDRFSFFKAFWKTEPFKKDELSPIAKESEVGPN